MTTPARSTVVLAAGMTHADAARAVALVWPDIVLELYVPTTAFYKEGFPYPEDSWTRDTDVLRVRPPPRGWPAPPDAVVITGGMSARVREEAVERLFGLIPEFVCRFGLLRGQLPDTLDEAQEFVRQARAAFVTRHGREPDRNSRFDGLIPGR
jgi:hypothetical protein